VQNFFAYSLGGLFVISVLLYAIFASFKFTRLFYKGDG